WGGPSDEPPPAKSGQGQSQGSASSKPVSQGLSADRSNAKYTQDTLNREGTPTRPLNPEVAKAAPPKPAPVAAEAVPAPVPVQTSDAAPPPVVQTVSAVPAPAPAPAAPTLRAPPVGPESVEDAYRRRLNEFTAPPAQPGAAFQSSAGLAS